MEDSSLVIEGKFGFGFNDIDFSDRVLRLEIISSPSNTNSGVEKYLNWFSSVYDHDSECGTTGFKAQTLHINSLILAAKSPFFYKLFKNGMRESHQRDDVTLKIHASEEAALMDLLNFMYGNPLSATSAPDLLDVLMAADKFEVTTCMKHCMQLLLNLPMSIEIAVVYVKLPSVVFVGEVTKPLIDAAKQYLVAHYSDFTKSQQEGAMRLPLCAIEVVFESDGITVNSEDDVFDFILKWGRAHYPRLEERREILTKRLARYIHFPYMSCLKLKEAVECPDFEYEQVSKSVLNAVFSKVDIKRCHVFSKDTLATSCGFPGRVYKHCCVVYFDIKRQDCVAMYTSAKRISSEAFCIGGRCFTLLALHHQEQQKSVPHFGLFVEMTSPTTCKLDFEFAVMKKPSKEFEIQVTNKCTLTKKDNARGDCLFKWTDLMRDESVYFIDGILHLRALVSINN